MSKDQLNALLHEGRLYGAEYQQGLSNHFPMALIALRGLGASDQRLVQFAEQYTLRLTAMPPPQMRISRKSWRDHLGLHRHNAEYVEFFGQEQHRLGTPELLNHYLPKLLPGIGGAAFHPLIRLGYALDLPSENEVVEALAAWAVAYLDLGNADPGEARGLQQALRDLRESEELRSCRLEGHLISDRMAQVAELPAFAGFGAWSPELDLPQLREVALQIYAGSNDDFTALHLVTATHALRLVLQNVAQLELHHFWRAMGTAYVALGMPPLMDSPTPLGREWDEIVGAAQNAPDDHVIKLVYTCRSEAEAYADERYRTLAARKVGF